MLGELGATKLFAAPIVTEVIEVTTVYPAEDYHQHHYEQNPHQPHCQFVVAPKVTKAEGRFGGRLK